MNLSESVETYTELLLPQLAIGICVTDTVSRLCYRRDEINEGWADLTEADRYLVRKADKVLISEAEKVSVFWKTDLRFHRDKYKPPKTSWWWFLHEIADNIYPIEILPDWVK